MSIGQKLWPLACIHTDTYIHTHRKSFQLKDRWRNITSMPLGLFVEKLQPKVGIAGCDIRPKTLRGSFVDKLFYFINKIGTRTQLLESRGICISNVLKSRCQQIQINNNMCIAEKINELRYFFTFLDSPCHKTCKNMFPGFYCAFGSKAKIISYLQKQCLMGHFLKKKRHTSSIVIFLHWSVISRLERFSVCMSYVCVLICVHIHKFTDDLRGHNFYPIAS